ncbi:Piwi-domain-containing protein [Calocera viscosa TUFC12733]|uniref:Piwi-domain-containing protein n=1 Tax=Calocera viscosa (strain TUFC12733) TaxID=1330018 RepID=A0A167GZM1_CALVF|nr:Piwi-domain-containing protein [Calocera viscosa TUFC12733]
MFGPVTRRPKGTAGNPIRVTTNMYPLQLHPDRVIYLYNVEIIPELSETASRRNYELIDILQTRAYPQAFTPRAAYDGSKIMLSTVQYPWGGAHEFNVVTSKRNPPPPPGQKGNFIIKLTAGPSFPIASLANYVRSPNSFPPDVVVNYTNIFLRMAPMSAHAFRGNNFYVTAGHKVFGDWLMLRRGFFQSVRATVNGPMVNMDITSALLWIQRPLMETIISILGLSDHRALSRLDERQLHHLNRLLKGIRVIPLHRQDAAPKVIRGFDRRGANSIRLDGDGITVEDYIHEKYNKRLSYPNYLCVSLSNDKQNILPIELLAIDKNQFFDLKKLANPVWDKQIRAFAMVKPSERLRITNTGCEVMQHAQSDYMIRAGIRVNPTALMVNARSLRPVVVSFANGSKVEPRHGAWRSQKFYQPSSIKFWAVIILDHQAPPQGVKNFIGQLVSVMEHGGMRVLDQTPTLYPKDARQDITQLLDYVKADLMKRFKEPPSLLLVVTPGDADWYTDVKRLGDITLGIPTQHVLTAKALQQRGSAEYCENVALKVHILINVKLGGINFVPHPDAISWIRNPNEPTMVVGADTSHPRPGEGWKPTVAAIAFSVDRDVSKYNGTVTIQKGRQEIIANIVSMLRTAITAFKKSARVAPRRILYYRDGVGEGMYEEIAQQELQGIRQAFKELNEAPPKITFIVVGKRHHLRFYPDKRDEDRSGNANPGLVIDNTITSTIHDDFYLLAHQGIIGTSRPMHAVPIMDENNLSSDMLQGLTFALTHNYQRATRSVSIPAPIYYADILCSPQRARIHFDGSVDFASETASSGGPVPTSTQYLQAFKPVALRMRDNMYWM